MKPDTLSTAVPDTLARLMHAQMAPAHGSAIFGLEVSDWVTLLTALVGVLVGALISGISVRRTRRRDLTYAMHREFFGQEMGKTRVEARERLPHVIGKSLSEMDREDGSAGINLPLWQMIRFYQRLAVMIEHDEVSRKMIPELFGGTFIWWYIVYFEDSVQNVNWTIADHLRLLHKQLEFEMRKQSQVSWYERPFKQRLLRAKKIQARWEVWIKDCEEGRARVLAEVAAQSVGNIATPPPKA
jgi:hypothetical protein